VIVHLKEVKLRPKTEEHDYGFKIRNIRRFLEEGNKARVTIMFRGREITHKELGQSVLDEVVGDLKEVAVVEQQPRMEGRQMFMILAPNAKVAQRARDLAKQHLAMAAAAKKQHGPEEKPTGTKPAQSQGKSADGIPAEKQQSASPIQSGTE
jgi:translation initiation factor IF-3